jgi:hypothetical protein
MNLLTSFLAGMLSANGIPHFVHGISGRRFPTPFAKPPGRGLSSPLLNVVWGLANFITGILLVKASGSLVISWNPTFNAFALGFSLAAASLAVFFKSSEKE